MKNYNEWKEKLKKDKHGGIIPQDMKVAKKVDLITLPPDVKGTNCENCKYEKHGFCEHKDVQQYVNERNCCALWDNDGVERPWK